MNVSRSTARVPAQPYGARVAGSPDQLQPPSRGTGPARRWRTRLRLGRHHRDDLDPPPASRSAYEHSTRTDEQSPDNNFYCHDMFKDMFMNIYMYILMNIFMEKCDDVAVRFGGEPNHGLRLFTLELPTWALRRVS